jgi:hypothetical protein
MIKNSMSGANPQATEATANHAVPMVKPHHRDPVTAGLAR